MLLKGFSAQTAPIIVDNETKQITYLTRIDPLSGNVSKISEERAKRNIAISVDLNIKPIEKCDFCNYKEKTPLDRFEHECGAVSVHNKFPWEKHDWITIYPPFKSHKLLLSDLYFDDLERMIESSFDLAQLCAKDSEALGFMDFTNWGPFSGASQQHPHSQRKSITHDLGPKQKMELWHCKGLWREHGRNPFDMLIEEERKQGVRMIHDNDLFIAAAFAPTCPDELIIFPREPFSHILQMNANDRKRMARPLLGIFPALFFYRGITDLNIAVHMAPFAKMEESRNYYRWHIHIYPRRSKLPVDKAGAEIGFDTNIIGSLPETTASVLRKWYEEGPSGQCIAKAGDEKPNACLVEQFEKFAGAHCLSQAS